MFISNLIVLNMELLDTYIATPQIRSVEQTKT
jgi:hypothetical protein